LVGHLYASVCNAPINKEIVKLGETTTNTNVTKLIGFSVCDDFRIKNIHHSHEDIYKYSLSE